MASNNQLALIEKLTGRENFATWRFAVKTYLQHEELWDCVEPEPDTIIDKKRDTKAKTKIILLVDPINYVHIQEAGTAKEVWDKLSLAFDDSGLTRRVGLLRDLCNTSLTGCQSIEEYVSKIMSTAHKLRNIGFKVDDEWLGTLLLSGLPESYQPMIIAIESSGMKITSDSVKSKLLQEVRKEENDCTSKAFSVNKKFHKNTKKQSKGPRCYTCNKYGHKSPECKFKTKDTNQKSNSSSYAAVFVATSTQDDVWYVDSGASSHMTKHKSLLQNVSTPAIQNIRVADNKVLTVQCSGQVSLDVYDDGGLSKRVLFTKVLYVPELATNLLSVSQIINSGGQVKFDRSGCVIMNNRGQIVATASLINNMYRLNTPGAGYACMSDVDKQDIYLWHQRMGHLNFQSLQKMTENTNYVTFSQKPENLTCVTCTQGKQTRLPFKREGLRSSSLLELVHSDICGPMETQTLGGAKYFITFLDDYSKKVYVYFLRNKSEALNKFKEFKNEVENQLSTNIKILRTDNGLEYVNKSFSEYLKSAGIIHQTTVPYSPEQNGTAERMNRTLIERAKCMLLNAKLSKMFWADAVHTAAYIINRSPTKSLSFKTPEEMWSGQKPNVDHMRIFGCEAMVHLPKEKRKKWDPKAQKMIFIGYCDHTKGYRFIIPNSRTVIKSRDAVFLESTVKRDYVPVEISEENPEKKDSETKEKINSDNSDEDSNTSIYDEPTYENTSDDTYLPDIKFDTPPASNITLRPRKKKDNTKENPENLTEDTYLYQHEAMLCMLSDVPVTYKEALSSIYKEEWRKSINEELNAHQKNNTWTLVEKPPNAKIIGCKWVFRVKEEPTGLRYKSRLCAKGYAQTAGIDYKETFAPTVSVPVDPHVKLQKGNGEPEKNLPYREAVGSLMHLAIVSRPDIMFAVSLVQVRYPSRKSHVRRQRAIPPSVPFPCEDALSWGRSPQRPTSVHRLRPGDIDVVAAIGDSLVAGSGALEEFALGAFVEYRGVSWCAGGDATWREYLTLPNILKEFNPNLKGFSTGTGEWLTKNAKFNVAFPVASDEDALKQAKILVARMRSSPEIDMENDWKMVTVFIGANDLCSASCLNPVSWSPAAHAKKLSIALDYLHKHLPRTIVNLVPVLDVSVSIRVLRPMMCRLMHSLFCTCFHQGGNEFYDLVRMARLYQKAETALVASGRYSSDEQFSVVVQPFMRLFNAPLPPPAPLPLVIHQSYITHDCFHFSQKGHALAANLLWNNLLEPVGNKSDNVPPILLRSFRCPSRNAPYFFTSKNSRSYLLTGKQDGADDVFL